jgi:hypothetical protein
MKVYAIDINGNFLNEHECQPCPITGGWLYPSNYTKIEPPVIDKFEKLKYVRDQWQIISTDQGKIIYSTINGSSKVCNEDSIPENFTLKEPIKDKPCKWENEDWVIDEEIYKQIKKSEIINSFNNELSNGKFTSTALGIEVDCRRSNIKNDLQNVQGLISHMNRNSKSTVTYIGYSESVEATKSKLEILCNEMEDYVLGLYQKKWQLEQSIDTATMEELENIKW